jgi:uncharacterized membrane protein YozB (DUF420 family)
MGIFGNSAELIVDINLIIQYVILVLLVIGYIKKKPYKSHGNLMLATTLLTLATILIIMAPRLVLYYTLYPPLIYVHAIIGVITIAIALLFNVRFVTALRGKQPLTCGTKTTMRIAVLIWLITLFGGTLIYLETYVFAA